MKIKLSRHAKRRVKLYKITESTVIDILTRIDPVPGKHEIIKDVKGLKYPLQIIFTFENDIITVITTYPLRKGRKK